MSIKITEECINCGACESECPNHAIYEGGKKWRMSDGTSLKKKKSEKIDFTIPQNPKKKDIYFIVSEKCTECVGFYEEPQCVIICPVSCCVLDEKSLESKEDLLKKKNFLHDSF
ncbi:MAG: 4Fe-4S dicluster domain-containing protein [Flavobacteriales bacterium]|jgi:ferredoxin|uniref:4Fe-4S binding protein n=1 Tax=Blattabacterium sp. (Mastotermes darwiniensis) TaxID=39768 RepID=UPI000231DEC2|nr:4Fe-4S binding protein [Blattabacterium sp. (Mastotermes darwiniensis)]AER40758.1 4Fe-4S ferredoxin, iron-sulfur binding protein [Blattabacterium sp. (Mastotermes darwiniensis) str. MADAR]MDR1804601.1 4Fe-4S dicluster domain-containing protein [Flavobacteriales bacterium]